MNDRVEFAEEYSASERRRLVVLGIMAGAALIVFGNAWFFPWLQEFSDTAACRSVLGFNGTVALFYGLFVGLPAIAGIGISLSFGLRGYRILRDGRVPPAGEKVFRRTRIVRGARAKWLGALHVLSVALPIALVFWGLGQAQRLSERAPVTPQRCALLTVNHH